MNKEIKVSDLVPVICRLFPDLSHNNLYEMAVRTRIIITLNDDHPSVSEARIKIGAILKGYGFVRQLDENTLWEKYSAGVAAFMEQL